VGCRPAAARSARGWERDAVRGRPVPGQESRCRPGGPGPRRRRARTPRRPLRPAAASPTPATCRGRAGRPAGPLGGPGGRGGPPTQRGRRAKRERARAKKRRSPAGVGAALSSAVTDGIPSRPGHRGRLACPRVAGTGQRPGSGLSGTPLTERGVLSRFERRKSTTESALWCLGAGGRRPWREGGGPGRPMSPVRKGV
jgi:hypothetical protein